MNSATCRQLVDGALLFHLLRKLYERTSAVNHQQSSFTGWSKVFGDTR
jgi:hypothetical protein